MTNQFGYWTDLSAVTLDDSEHMVSTFQAAPFGVYDHPVYGKIKFDDKVVSDIVSNFNSNARGTELDIDYDHKAKSGEAAGWVKAAEKRSDGLYLTVEWTKDAWTKIKNKAYRYFSPEFASEWTHPKTGNKYQNVLFGGGITNRPFLKDILPLNMSELFEEQKEGNNMDREKLIELLGLSADATDEQIETAIKERPQNESGTENKNTSEQEDTDTTELSEDIIKLAESSPAIKALVDSVQSLQTTVATQSAALQLAETEAKVVKLSEPVNGRQLPASVQKQLQSVLLDAPKALSDKIVSLFESFNKVGYVQLGEIGESSNVAGDGAGEDASKKFNDAVTKLIKDNEGMSYGDAVERVAATNPELFEGYRQSSYAFKEA